MSQFAPLRVETHPDGLLVQGGTFALLVDKRTGLLREVTLLGKSWLAAGSFLPDMWLTDAIDPREKRYQARNEGAAQLRVVQESAEAVVVETSGAFRSESGETFPIRWQITYTVSQDGTCCVDVETASTKDTRLRWGAFAAGAFRPEACPLLVVEGDMATSLNTCRPIVYELDQGEIADVHGQSIPWFQVGNDNAAIDVVFPHTNESTWSWTDSSPYPTGDPLGRPEETVFIQANGGAGVDAITWHRYAFRNVNQWMLKGTTFTTRFYLAFLPAKTAQPEYDQLSVYWEGPHQLAVKYTAPSPLEVDRLADMGVQLVIGGVNWASGYYSNPENKDNALAFMRRCRQRGIKVLPYITFHDLEYSSPVSPVHDAEWRITPIAEFKFCSHLMCTGAQGWREHWKDQISQVVDMFDLDGLYIDFWAGKLTCINENHGCTGPYGRFNIEGLRELAQHAKTLLLNKNPHALIVSNTNVLPLAMINNYVDVRLLGEWHNIEQTDRKYLRAFYNPKRYRCNNLLLTGRVPQITPRTAALSIASAGSLAVRHRRGSRSEGEIQAWEDLRQCLYRLVQNQPPTLNAYECSQLFPLPEQVYVNVYAHGQNQALVSVGNLAAEERVLSATLQGDLVKRVGGSDSGGELEVYGAGGAAQAGAGRLHEGENLTIPAGGWVVLGRQAGNGR